MESQVQDESTPTPLSPTLTSPDTGECSKESWSLGNFIKRGVATWCNLPCLGGWKTTPELRKHFPKTADYRDEAPEELEDVSFLYTSKEGIVRDGRWTFGLFEMWFPKAKPVKHSTHIPCWDSYKINPLKWRGIVFGRTCKECYWTGLRQMRWSRAVYAANLGREYIMPVQDVHGKGNFKGDIEALCWMTCLMGCLFSCGIGQIFTLCGNVLFNCAAPYTCHARYKLRKKYNLPPAFCMPPGVDDYLVHFLCFYCSSYQELREIAVRGVDGPGMCILDVVPESFEGAKGGPAAIAARKELVATFYEHPPQFFGEKKTGEATRLNVRTVVDATMLTAGRVKDSILIIRKPEPSTVSLESASEFGWVQYKAPEQQVMEEGVHRTVSRAWSVAY